jgi:hypothetical protein
MATMRWHSPALDDLFAPNLSKLTICGPEELSVRDNLLPEFILQTIFTSNFGNDFKKKTLNLIRHVNHASFSYTAARASLVDYLSDQPGKRVSAYFNAISHFESHVAHLNLARWLSMRIAHPDQKELYKAGSGCVDEQLQVINNQIKHLYDKIGSGEMPENHSVIMWLSNEGLETAKCSVTFSDLAAVLGDCYGVTFQIVRELPKRLAEMEKQKALVEKSDLPGE